MIRAIERESEELMSLSIGHSWIGLTGSGDGLPRHQARTDLPQAAGHSLQDLDLRGTDRRPFR